MIDNPTAFQQLVNNDEVPRMISDLEDLEGLVPDDDEPEDLEDYNYELALSFHPEDVPLILEELEELVDDNGE